MFSMRPLDGSFPPGQIEFMAGFECTYARTRPKEHLDMLSCTMHDHYIREDYDLVKSIGIKTVREGLSWSQIDKGYSNYDFSRFLPIIKASQEKKIRVIWDLNHFDYPDDLDPFGEEFVVRFREYSKRAYEILRQNNSGPLAIIPINEISFMAWIGADRGWWAPFKKGPANGLKLKKQLVRAALASIKAIRQMDPEAIFIHSDPFMRRLATSRQKKVQQSVADFNQIIRFEAWDMLSGRTYPELGGSPEYLPAIGINYYFHNQEYVSMQERKLKFEAMPWESKDRIILGEMLNIIQKRYQVPILVTETGSFGQLRPQWWQRTLDEVEQALTQGIDIRGVCAYPILDRPEDVNYLYPNSGLWDFDRGDGQLTRIPENQSLELIQKFIQRHNN